MRKWYLRDTCIAKELSDVETNRVSRPVRTALPWIKESLPSGNSVAFHTVLLGEQASKKSSQQPFMSKPKRLGALLLDDGAIKGKAII
eukprot:scaffold198684_cov61-Attheya_sp.AAC.1